MRKMMMPNNPYLGSLMAPQVPLLSAPQAQPQTPPGQARAIEARQAQAPFNAPPMTPFPALGNFIRPLAGRTGVPIGGMASNFNPQMYIQNQLPNFPLLTPRAQPANIAAPTNPQPGSIY